MKTKARLPNLSNYTAQGIVDELGPLQEELNRLQTLSKYYKTALKARLTDQHRIDPLTYCVRAEKYVATISDGEQIRLSNDKVREILTEEQYANCLVEIPTQVIRFERFESTSTNTDSTNTNTDK